MDGQQPIPDTKRKGSPNGAQPQTMDAKNDKSNGKPGLVNKLSVRCTQFLDSISKLDDSQADQLFVDLFKSKQLHETISLEELRDTLTNFIKEIKNKHDVELQLRRATEEWIISEIKYIHQMLKEPQSTSTQTLAVPAHLEVVLKDIKHMIDTIHAKFHADSKEKINLHERKLPSGQSPTPNVAKLQTSLPNVRIKQLEKENQQLRKDLHQKEENIEKRQEELKKLQQNNTELMQENSTLKSFAVQIEDLKSKIRKADSDLAVSQNNNAALEKKCGEAEQNVRRYTQENKDLQQRYSTLAGAKMAHDNPDIADLSDPYRPTKIAEMFSELYDNQWTDCFAAFTKHEKDEKAIQILMSMLKEADAFCKKETQSLRQTLRIKIQEICTRSDAVSSKQKPQKGGHTDLVKGRRVDDIIRDNAMLPVKVLQEKFLKESEPKRKKLTTDKDGVKAVNDYFEKCVELCWLMAIQSPPVAIDDNVKVYENQRFDERRFKPYTKKGKIVDYVVWPVLLISDGGMLGKGVAQCK